MKMVSAVELGSRIKTTREKVGMTQHDLYKKTGISTTQISAYENGKKSIGLQTLAKISCALGVSIDYIYYGSEELKPITSSTNKGELIINCITALFDLGVVSSLYHEEVNDYVEQGLEQYYSIGFKNYVEILDDLISKLSDFEKEKENYPDPSGFRSQLLASAVNKINNLDKYSNN